MSPHLRSTPGLTRGWGRPHTTHSPKVGAPLDTQYCVHIGPTPGQTLIPESPVKIHSPQNICKTYLKRDRYPALRKNLHNAATKGRITPLKNKRKV